MRPLTVRFSPAAYDVIRDIAADNGISQAELVRMSVAGKLESYLGTIRIIDSGQAAEIKQAIIDLYNLTAQVQMELNRIGVNFNQMVKYMHQTGDTSKISFPEDEIEKIIERFEEALTQAGDQLCLILA